MPMMTKYHSLSNDDLLNLLEYRNVGASPLMSEVTRRLTLCDDEAVQAVTDSISEDAESFTEALAMCEDVESLDRLKEKYACKSREGDPVDYNAILNAVVELVGTVLENAPKPLRTPFCRVCEAPINTSAEKENEL